MSKVQIFVSYAHADLEPDPASLVKASRVGTILATIKHGLRCHDPRSDFAVLRDEEGLIRVSDNIDDKVEHAIAACDLGLILMSRSYCASEECRGELRKLLDKNKPLSIVEAEPVWDDDIENEMRIIRPRIDRTLRAQFYGGHVGNRHLFGYPLPQLLEPSERAAYDKAAKQVVQDIEARGRDIIRARKVAQGLPAESIDDHTVFLGYATADARNEINSLSVALQKAGYSALCFNPNLHVAPGSLASQVIKSAIEKCDVLVQMLGGVPGAQYEGRPLVMLQHDLAKESGKPFFIWRSSAFDPNEIGLDYSTFLQSTQCHQSSYEEFEKYVVKQVDFVVRARESAQRRIDLRNSVGARDEILPLVTIDVAAPDYLIADAVADALKPFVGVSSLPFDLDRTQLNDAVSDNDGIVMVYSESREGQLRINAHFPIVQKIRRRNPLFDIAIGNGLSNERKINAPPYPRGPNVHVIKVDRQRMEVDASSLDEFVEGLRANATKRA
jgi:hypothetical protein